MPKPVFAPEQLEIINNRVDSLLVPIALWTAYIENNSRIRFDNFLPTPDNIQVAEFIVTENEWFLDIVKSKKYTNYTIDALSQLSGFSSRHHLYKPFKKFHGGIPSDFIKSLDYV